MPVYSAPIVKEVAKFRKATRGVWFGKFRDVFGGKAVVRVSIEW